MVYDAKEKNKAEDRTVKLAKLRNLVNGKASILNEIMSKLDAFQASESTCHECTSKDEVENYKRRLCW